MRHPISDLQGESRESEGQQQQAAESSQQGSVEAGVHGAKKEDSHMAQSCQGSEGSSSGQGGGVERASSKQGGVGSAAQKQQAMRRAASHQDMAQAREQVRGILFQKERDGKITKVCVLSIWECVCVCVQL